MTHITWKLVQAGEKWTIELKAVIDTISTGNTKEEAVKKALRELKRQIGEMEHEKRATG